MKPNSSLSSSLLRSAAILFGGSGLSSLIVLLSTLWLTRLYAPSEFNDLAIFVSFVGVIASAACLRFDIALTIPEHERRANDLLILALLSSFVFSLTLAVLVSIMPKSWEWIFGTIGKSKMAWLLPLGIWMASSYSAIQYWLVRKKKFALLSKYKIYQTLAGVSVQILIGELGGGAVGLMLGQIMISGISSLVLVFGLSGAISSYAAGAWPKILYVTFRRYNFFPKYSVPESVLNMAGIQVPVILIGTMLLNSEAAYLFLAMRIMQAPMALMGMSISQLYLSEAPKAMRDSRLPDLTISVIRGLLRAGVGPLLLAGLLAPALTPLVFGSNWERSGTAMLYMTPWFVMQFLTSPISMALQVTKNQKTALVLQSFGFLLRVGFVVVGVRLFPQLVIEIYAAAGFIFYSVYFLVLMKICGIGVARLISEVKKEVVLLSLALLGSLTFLATSSGLGRS